MTRTKKIIHTLGMLISFLITYLSMLFLKYQIHKIIANKDTPRLIILYLLSD